MNSQDTYPLHQIRQKWTEPQRRIIWTLISKARQRLRIELDPVVATAFVLLQKFFRDNECSYDVIILMTAALFTSCKQTDSFRSMLEIYTELFRLCAVAPSRSLRSLLYGHRMVVPMDITDVDLITQAELDLLDATGYDFCIELPFTYSTKVAEVLAAVFPEDRLQHCHHQMAVDICLALCSDVYLDVPPEVTAAAATIDSLACETIPDQIVSWIKDVISKYGVNVFNVARIAITMEKEKTAKSY